MRVECTIHDPWLEEFWLQREQYFCAQDPISAHHNWQHWVCYIKLCNMKIYDLIYDKMLLIVIVIALSCRLCREMVWSLCKKNSLSPS